VTNYRDNAIVLRTYKLGEADRIIVLLTEHHGKVRAVAKGVRKTTSKIGARLEPLNHVDVLLHRGRDLDTVSQVDLLSASNDLRSDLDVLTAGMALLEGADHMTQDREACPQTYRMLLGAITTLAQGSSPVLVAAFYWKMLAAEGLSIWGWNLHGRTRPAATDPRRATCCSAWRGGVRSNVRGDRSRHACNGIPQRATPPKQRNVRASPLALLVD